MDAILYVTLVDFGWPASVRFTVLFRVRFGVRFSVRDMVRVWVRVKVVYGVWDWYMYMGPS